MDIRGFWKAVLAQDATAIRKYFSKSAYINWHCTNEHFTVDEFILANCKYPGNWDGTVERIETSGDRIITVTRVFAKHTDISFHVTSFIRTEDDAIVSIDEYWGDDGNPPQWRRDMHIGAPIR